MATWKIFLIMVFLLLCSSAVTASSEFLNLKWEYSIGQAINGISVADFNADGKKEIAAATSRGGEVFFIDSDGERQWRKTVFCPIYAINSVDLNGSKILVGACTHLHFFDSSGEQTSPYFTNHAPVLVIFPTDINDDGSPEILIGAGDPSSSRKNNLYLIDRDKKTLWKKGLPIAPYSLDVKDINADGLKDIVIGMRALAIRAGASAGKISVYDEEGNLNWDISLKRGIYKVKIEDIDGDGNFEIIAGSFHKVYVFDKNGQETWSYDTGGYVRSLDVLKIEGKKKLVVGSDNLLVFNSDLTLDWEYNTEDEIYTLRVGDLDGDGLPEIFAGSNKLYLFTHDGKLLWNSDSYLAVKGLAWEDLDEDGYKELILGTSEGKVSVFETKGYVLKEQAEENLKKAQALYEKKDYETALSLALKAKESYQLLEQAAKIKECRNLILEINATHSESLRNWQEAQEYWNKSLTAYLADDFRQALLFARKAKLYLETVKKENGEIKESLEKYNSLINNSLVGLNLLADSYYDNASKFYKSGKYPSAFNAIQEANLIYEWINNTPKSKESNELLAKLSYKLAEQEYRQNNLENATQRVEEALYLYTNLGNETYQKEIKQCKDLKKKITEGPITLSQKIQEKALWILLVLIVILIVAFIHWGLPLIRERALEKESWVEPPEKVEGSEIEEIKEEIPEEPEKTEEVKEESKPKPKVPKLDPITKDQFKGTGRSLKV